MSERFFVPAPPVSGRAVLSGEEARHLARVLRAEVGDAVSLFDGSGREWPARVVAIGRERVDLETGAALVASPSGGTHLTLGVALPKGERQKWMVEKLTELGVEKLVPLETTRGVAEATAAARTRLERAVIEACKQCGRNTLLEITPPRTIATLVAEAPAGTRLVIAHPGADALGPLPAGVHVIAMVGPEGGFTDAELAAAEAAGASRAGLGPHVLRVETAALALAARCAG